MTPLQKEAIEGFAYVVGMVWLVGLGIAICSGVIGLVVFMVRWMMTIVLGGCA